MPAYASRDSENLAALIAESSGSAGIVTFPAAAIPADGVSQAEVLRQVYAALEGTAASQNGVATWPASAAPGNNVSIAEVLGWINDAIQGTSGVVTWAAGAAPANAVSIAEAIRFISEAITDGAAFSQTVDPGGTARASVELAIGDLGAMLAGTAGITTYPTAAAYGNAVSLAEVLAYVQDGVRRGTGTTLPANTSLADYAEAVVTNTAAVLVSGTTIFTIAGGPIEITHLSARCVTANDGTASMLQWSADPTDGSAATISAASASLANAAEGAVVTLQGTALSTAALLSATGHNLCSTIGTYVGAGILTTTVGVGSTTGTWMHHMRYKPLAKGVTVT